MKKKNNRGFSLIELLVSVTILAIIVIPLMHSFITAVRTNEKAKRTLNATTAGQNLVEQIKAESLKEVLDSVDDANKVIEQVMIPDPTAPTDPSKARPAADANGPVNKYTLTYKDINVNGQMYQAVVTLDPSAYIDQGNKVDGEGNPVVDLNAYNSIAISQVSNMNSAVSAFLIMEPGDDLKAARSIDGEHYEDVLKSLKRKIVLMVDCDASSGAIIVTADIHYDYNGADILYKSAEIYKNDVSDPSAIYMLENLFVFFTPMYNNSSPMLPSETVEIHNPKNLPLKVYLVRQDAAADDVTKNRYGVDVLIAEGDGASPVTKLITNLTTAEFIAESELQLTYKQGLFSKTGQDAIAALGVQAGDLANAQNMTRIYDIEVKVYKNDDEEKTNLLATLGGTKTE